MPAPVGITRQECTARSFVARRSEQQCGVPVCGAIWPIPAQEFRSLLRRPVPQRDRRFLSTCLTAFCLDHNSTTCRARGA
jgi:hypothetical protein